MLIWGATTIWQVRVHDCVKNSMTKAVWTSNVVRFNLARESIRQNSVNSLATIYLFIASLCYLYISKNHFSIG